MILFYGKRPTLLMAWDHPGILHLYFILQSILWGLSPRSYMVYMFSSCLPRHTPHVDRLYRLLLQFGHYGHGWPIIGRLSTYVSLVPWTFMDYCTSELVAQNAERRSYWWTSKPCLMETSPQGWGHDVNMKSRAEKWLSLFPFLYAGSLQIQYNLGGTREPYNIDVDHRSMANGQPHSVNITRRERTITLKVRTCHSSIVARQRCGLCPLSHFSECSITQACPTLQPHGQQLARLLCPRDSPSQNASVGCHFLLPLSYLAVVLGFVFVFVLFWVVGAGGRDASDTFFYKLLTSDVERYAVGTGKTMRVLMEKRFLGRRQNKCLLYIFFVAFPVCRPAHLSAFCFYPLQHLYPPWSQMSEAYHVSQQRLFWFIWPTSFTTPVQCE